MRTSQLVIDANKSVGRKLALTDVAPVYRYSNGQRTDNIEGYRYTVCMLDNGKGYEKLAVKVAGDKQIELNSDEMQLVSFDNLELHVYAMNGTVNVSATAAAVHVAGKA